MKKLMMIPAALLVFSSAYAAPKISAQSIIVNPVQPDVSISVRVDKDASGNQNPSYTIGAPIKISATVNRDAYVYFFSVSSDGSITQILPNKLSEGNFVKANTTTTFPAAGAQFVFNVDGPIGQNKVLALASLSPLNLDEVSSFKTNQDKFATVKADDQAGLAQALSIVVNPIPQNSWVSDTAFFTVEGKTPVNTGSLFVGTNVNNASIILNGQRLGDANTTYSGLRSGSFPIRVQAPGYRDYQNTVEIRAGRTTNLNVDMTQTAVTPPVASQYTLTINSNLDGRVFINGSEAGTIRNGSLSVAVSRGSNEVVVINSGYRTFVGNYNVTQSAQITVNPSR